jgi:hypothetical protein
LAPDEAISGGERQGRRPLGGWVNMAAGLAVLLVIGLTALSATPTPPPAIAEISPQAQRQITQAPLQQTSRFGSGQGQAVPGASTTTTTVPKPGSRAASTTTTTPTTLPPTVTTVVASTFQCVGDPPRQTADPQSPPCIATWQGNNGGATYQGVTASSITVVIPNYSTTNVWPILADYFNSHFEFYGRKLVLVDGSSLSMGEPQTDLAAAEAVQSQYHAFAAGSGNVSDFYFYADVAREGLLALPIQETFSDAQLETLHNVYQYPMGADHVLANVGAWACARLAGQPATHAGSGVVGKKRVFGVVFMKDWSDNTVSPSPLDQQLASCGAGPAAERDFTFTGGTANGAIGGTISPQDATSTLVAMRNAGVTSIVCACESYNLGTLMKAASAQAYYPEWLVSSYIDLDIASTIKEVINSPDQLDHMFGITALPRRISAASDPALQAVFTEDPGYQTNASDYESIIQAYRPLLLLASGIQMAGPHLTAQSFAAGLARTIFPNPATSIVAGAVGFNVPGAQESMTKDLAEWWWSSSATDSWGEPGGSLCYVDGGARHSIGNWPRGGDPFFGATCDTGSNL